MVDFNNDTTITGRSAEDILRVIIMERRYNLFEAIETYVKLHSEGAESSMETAVIKARAFSLFMEIEETVQRHLANKPEEMALLLLNLKSNKYDDLICAVRTMMNVLDKVKLTRLDTKVPYDSTRVTVEDKVKGHG